jgi:hypothetical protein
MLFLFCFGSVNLLLAIEERVEGVVYFGGTLEFLQRSGTTPFVIFSIAQSFSSSSVTGVA